MQHALVCKYIILYCTCVYFVRGVETSVFLCFVFFLFVFWGVCGEGWLFLLLGRAARLQRVPAWRARAAEIRGERIGRFLGRKSAWPALTGQSRLCAGTAPALSGTRRAPAWALALPTLRPTLRPTPVLSSTRAIYSPPAPTRVRPPGGPNRTSEAGQVARPPRLRARPRVLRTETVSVPQALALPARSHPSASRDGHA